MSMPTLEQDVTPLTHGQERGLTGATVNGTYFLSVLKIWMYKYDATTLWTNSWIPTFIGIIPI